VSNHAYEKAASGDYCRCRHCFCRHRCRFLYDDLRKVDPTHSSAYDEGTAIARKMQEIEAKLIVETPKNIATIAQAKDLKFLRQNVENAAQALRHHI
jgi:hypothetical protein